MVKANFLIVSIFSAAVIMIDNLLKGRASVAAGIAIGLSAMFAVAWSVSGQRLADLPAFFANAWSIIEGYDQIVGLNGPSTFATRGVLVAILAVAAVVLRILGASPLSDGVP